MLNPCGPPSYFGTACNPILQALISIDEEDAHSAKRRRNSEALKKSEAMDNEDDLNYRRKKKE